MRAEKPFHVEPVICLVILHFPGAGNSNMLRNDDTTVFQIILYYS